MVFYKSLFLLSAMALSVAADALQGPFTGPVTWYYAANPSQGPDQPGACGQIHHDNDFIVALAKETYDHYPGATDDTNDNPVCGKNIKVNYKTHCVVVKVVDRCDSCDDPGAIDLSPAAFSILASKEVGMLNATWDWTNDPAGKCSASSDSDSDDSSKAGPKHVANDKTLKVSSDDSKVPVAADHSGPATWFYVGNPDQGPPQPGACGQIHKDTDFVVAIAYGTFDTYPGSNGDPNANPICGQNIEANYNGKCVVVTVVDRCASCPDKNAIDLSPSAFSVLASQDVGLLEGVTWAYTSEKPGPCGPPSADASNTSGGDGDSSDDGSGSNERRSRSAGFKREVLQARGRMVRRHLRSSELTP